MSRLAAIALLLDSAVLSACGGTPPASSYKLEGQVLAIDASARTLTIRHTDIPGFMPGMTMPFRVGDPALMEGRKPGDLVRATLMVQDTDAWLSAIETTGWAPVDVGPAPAAFGVDILEPGDEVPDQVFVDQDGREVALSAYRGQVVALTFVYTRCPYPTFCPLMDRQFKAVQDQLAADPALAGRVHLLSISFDPDHDTPDVMKAHAELGGADPALWSYVTAPADAVDRFSAPFGLTIVRNPNDPLDLTHTLRTAVVGPDGRLAALHVGNSWSPDDLLRDVRHAASQR